MKPFTLENFYYLLTKLGILRYNKNSSKYRFKKRSLLYLPLFCLFIFIAIKIFLIIFYYTRFKIIKIQVNKILFKRENMKVIDLDIFLQTTTLPIALYIKSATLSVYSGDHIKCFEVKIGTLAIDKDNNISFSGSLEVSNINSVETYYICTQKNFFFKLELDLVFRFMHAMIPYYFKTSFRYEEKRFESNHKDLISLEKVNIEPSNNQVVVEVVFEIKQYFNFPLLVEQMFLNLGTITIFNRDFIVEKDSTQNTFSIIIILDKKDDILKEHLLAFLKEENFTVNVFDLMKENGNNFLLEFLSQFQILCEWDADDYQFFLTDKNGKRKFEVYRSTINKHQKSFKPLLCDKGYIPMEEKNSYDFKDVNCNIDSEIREKSLKLGECDFLSESCFMYFSNFYCCDNKFCFSITLNLSHLTYFFNEKVNLLNDLIVEMMLMINDIDFLFEIGIRIWRNCLYISCSFLILDIQRILEELLNGSDLEMMLVVDPRDKFGPLFKYFKVFYDRKQLILTFSDSILFEKMFFDNPSASKNILEINHLIQMDKINNENNAYVRLSSSIAYEEKMMNRYIEISHPENVDILIKSEELEFKSQLKMKRLKIGLDYKLSIDVVLNSILAVKESRFNEDTVNMFEIEKSHSRFEIIVNGDTKIELNLKRETQSNIFKFDFPILNIVEKNIPDSYKLLFEISNPSKRYKDEISKSWLIHRFELANCRLVLFYPENYFFALINVENVLFSVHLSDKTINIFLEETCIVGCELTMKYLLFSDLKNIRLSTDTHSGLFNLINFFSKKSFSNKGLNKKTNDDIILSNVVTSENGDLLMDVSIQVPGSVFAFAKNEINIFEKTLTVENKLLKINAGLFIENYDSNGGGILFKMKSKIKVKENNQKYKLTTVMAFQNEGKIICKFYDHIRNFSLKDKKHVTNSLLDDLYLVIKKVLICEQNSQTINLMLKGKVVADKITNILGYYVLRHIKKLSNINVPKNLFVVILVEDLKPLFFEKETFEYGYFKLTASYLTLSIPLHKYFYLKDLDLLDKNAFIKEKTVNIGETIQKYKQESGEDFYEYKLEKYIIDDTQNKEIQNHFHNMKKKFASPCFLNNGSDNILKLFENEQIKFFINVECFRKLMNKPFSLSDIHTAKFLRFFLNSEKVKMNFSKYFFMLLPGDFIYREISDKLKIFFLDCEDLFLEVYVNKVLVGKILLNPINDVLKPKGFYLPGVLFFQDIRRRRKLTCFSKENVTLEFYIKTPQSKIFIAEFGHMIPELGYTSIYLTTLFFNTMGFLYYCNLSCSFLSDMRCVSTFLKKTGFQDEIQEEIFKSLRST